MTKHFLWGLCAAGLLTASAYADSHSTVNERLTRSSEVLHQMLGTQTAGIPAPLVKEAQCVVVIPDMKRGAFIVGARYGAGFASCRTDSSWSAPAAVQIEGGSFGAQIGAKETDLVVFMMNQKARDQLLQDKVGLGATASIEAGPVGRAVSTDNADMLVWTRSNGAFVELSVNGATLEQDDSANKTLYGRDLSNREILTGKVETPAAASGFLSTIKSAK